MGTEYKHIKLRLESDLVDQLDKLARKLNLSRNAIIKLLIIQNGDAGIQIPNIRLAEEKE